MIMTIISSLRKHVQMFHFSPCLISDHLYNDVHACIFRRLNFQMRVNFMCLDDKMYACGHFISESLYSHICINNRLYGTECCCACQHQSYVCTIVTPILSHSKQIIILLTITKSQNADRGDFDRWDRRSY